MEIKTARMIMKTNIQILNGHLELPQKAEGINLPLSEHNVLDGGFIFYNVSGERICHISIRQDRKPNEICFGTEQTYRGQKYMQEAISTLLDVLDKNSFRDELYALVCNNPESEHILLKSSFVRKEAFEHGGTWLFRRIR